MSSFPFIIPIFGFGSGGLLSFLILFAVTGAIINSLRKGVIPPTDNDKIVNPGERIPVKIIQVQIALLANAKSMNISLSAGFFDSFDALRYSLPDQPIIPAI